MPSRPVKPLTHLDLQVVLGDEENFRSETILFEAVPLCMGYNAILSKPGYVKFMALPTDVYL